MIQYLRYFSFFFFLKTIDFYIKNIFIINNRVILLLYIFAQFALLYENFKKEKNCQINGQQQTHSPARPIKSFFSNCSLFFSL